MLLRIPLAKLEMYFPLSLVQDWKYRVINVTDEAERQRNQFCCQSLRCLTRLERSYYVTNAVDKDEAIYIVDKAIYLCFLPMQLARLKRSK